MPDYAAASETIFPTTNDIAATAGNGRRMLESNLANILTALRAQNFVVSGFVIPSSDADLNIDIPTGVAWIGGYRVSVPGSTTVTFTNAATNYVFLKLTRDGNNNVTGVAFEVNTTGTAPTDSVMIAAGIAAGGAITDAWDARYTTPFGWNPVSGPTSIGTGSTRTHEGDVAVTGATTLGGVHFYRSFYLKSGVTLAVDSAIGFLCIIAETAITLNGVVGGNASSAIPGTPAVSGVGTAGASATSQPGGGGGGGDPNAGGQGGNVIQNGFTLYSGGAGGGVGAPGSAPTSAASGSKGMKLLNALLMTMGGAPGGAGGGDGGSNGGAGGRGGADIILIAPIIKLAGTCTLNTAGQDGGAGAANRGAGGGGGAGNVWILTRSYTDSGATFTLTGGAGGAGGAGANGGAGSTGFKQILVYA